MIKTIILGLLIGIGSVITASLLWTVSPFLSYLFIGILITVKMRLEIKEPMPLSTLVIVPFLWPIGIIGIAIDWFCNTKI